MTDDEPLDVGDSPTFDLHQIELLLGIPDDEDAVFSDYLTHVANAGLLPYKQIIHYSESAGGKAGESLFMHVLTGIFVLEQLRRLLHLSDEETRTLFTAFTLHDINKVGEHQQIPYIKLATRDHVIDEMTKLKLDCFFPGYDTYLEDILVLMQHHPAHQWTGIEAFDLRRRPAYQLGDRLASLELLMKAADEIDLSHSLDEQAKKAAFLHHLNSFSDTQYIFVTHRIAEQRGSFTNLVHNAVIAEMQERFALTPLFLYPDGVAYLCPRAQRAAVVPDESVIAGIARRVAATINEMTSEGFQAFIRPINMGITVDPKCLDLQLSFATLLNAIYSIIQKRTIKADRLQRLTDDAIKRTHEILAKAPASADVIAVVEALLQSGPVPQTQADMRIGELLRSYYIFLLEHLADHISQPWTHIYQLLDLPTEQQAIYDCFNARMDRAYAIATQLELSEADVYERIKQDGTALLASQERADPRLPVLMDYIQRVLVFNNQPRAAADFADVLPAYVQQQHKQCVQCSLPLTTRKWRAADVRSDIKIQLFSNRLAGGPGEPVKHICDICQMQFLVEKLNYREIRGEQTVYLHLFPYSFLTAPFLNGLRTEVKRIKDADGLAGALRLNDAATAIAAIAEKHAPKLTFTTHTKEDKAQPYGVYLPRYSDTMGGVMTFPINPAGENDTQQFLFVLQHALLLHHHFGCKVLVSTAATPPLDPSAFGDVYFDLTPLRGRGLIRQNDYHTYQPNTRKDGSLRALWKQLGYLVAIRAQVLVPKVDPLAELVAAMADHPLRLFYVAEKLAEGRSRADSKAGVGWIIRTIADNVCDLAKSIGGNEMKKLDHELQRLAEIAWRGGLRGQSLEKNALLAPMDEVLRKVGLLGQEINAEVARAAAIQDLYDHIERIRKTRDQRYSPTRLLEASEAFVRVFFEDIFGTIYGGKTARLLTHEKLLRSAFHFYIRRQIPRKDSRAPGEPTEDAPAEETPTTDDRNVIE